MVIDQINKSTIKTFSMFNTETYMSIEERQNRIIERFSIFDDWMDKYEYLIDLAKKLPGIDPAYQTDENIVEGCQSTVWVHAESVNGSINYVSYSNTVLTQGLIALLLTVFNDLPAKEIIEADLFFIDKIGLSSNLSPSRANGLMSIVTRMKKLALWEM